MTDFGTCCRFVHFEMVEKGCSERSTFAILVIPSHDHEHCRPVTPPTLILTKHVHSFLEAAICVRRNTVPRSSCGRSADTNLVANRYRSHRLSVCRSCVIHSTVYHQVLLREKSKGGNCKWAHPLKRILPPTTYATSPRAPYRRV